MATENGFRTDTVVDNQQIWVVWNSSDESGEEYTDYLEAVKAAEEMLNDNDYADEDDKIYILKAYEVISFKKQFLRQRL